MNWRHLHWNPTNEIILLYRNVPIRSAPPNRRAPQVSLHIVMEL